MDISPTQQVWIYLDEGDSHRGHSVAGQVLEALRAAGCPGATVLRGVGGYGVHGVIHSDLAVEITGHLPLVITFIDREDRVRLVLPALGELVAEGLIAVTPVQVVKYSHREGGPFPRHLTVAEVMTRNPASVGPDAPVAEVVALLIERALRALPVVTQDGTVLGIITDGDLLRRGATSLPLRLQHLLPLAERAAQVESLAGQPRRAADLMTPEPATLPVSTPLGQAAAAMASRDLKRMPVVDAAGRLVGMVSRYDLLKTVAEGLRQRPSEPLRLPAGAPATVSDLMITDVPAVHRATPLAETLDLLLESEKRRVVVLDDEQRVAGIITDGDVLRRAARRVQAGALKRLAAWLGGGARPEELEVAAKGRTAAEIMTSPVITVTPETPTAETIRLMMEHKVKRLPVVDAAGHLVGMVGRAAVLAALQDGGPPA
ncbi:MAG: CBS domain-containing protein [Chloroflexales bacterium]|nr:CBS domain-containing protein [Chloroflexales bacterium]